jgi:hypothetical protein
VQYPWFLESFDTRQQSHVLLSSTTSTFIASSHTLSSFHPPNNIHPSTNNPLIIIIIPSQSQLEKLSFRLLSTTTRLFDSLAIVRYLISHPFDLVINLLCYFLKSFVSLFHFQVSYFACLCLPSLALKPIECGGAFMVISSGTQKLNSNSKKKVNRVELGWDGWRFANVVLRCFFLLESVSGTGMEVRRYTFMVMKLN